MLPYQERVIHEKKELDERLARFRAFCDTTQGLTEEYQEQGRLNRQHRVMEEYSSVLKERIAAFITPIIGRKE